MASKKAHKEFHEQRTPVHPTGYHAPRTPQEALALGPGSKFMDTDGNLRMVPNAGQGSVSAPDLTLVGLA
jgi:hypothetical protein